MKRLVLTTFTFILFAFYSIGQEIKLKGRVFEDETPLNDVTIVIYNNDSYFDEVEVNKSGKFKISLEENQDYELEIRKDGYLSKHINLTLNAANTEDEIPPFAFDVDLYKASKFKHVRVNMKSTPAAHIYYNTEISALDWDRSVTAEAKTKIAELKKQNSLNRRAKYSNF